MAVFPADHAHQAFRELALSLVTLEAFVAPHIELEVVIYTTRRFVASLSAHCDQLDLNCRLIAIDEREQGAADQAFASSLQHLTLVDRICVVRMLSDAELLNPSRYRLLLGADVFFLEPPTEVIDFARGGTGVLYMQDHLSTKGPYRIRYFEGDTLESFLGDFCCLSPGVQFGREAVMDCLRMIDAWPTEPSRYDPPLPGVTTPEQHAASILLARFAGRALPTERYAHIVEGECVMHTHTLFDVLVHLAPSVRHRYAETLGFRRVRLVAPKGQIYLQPREDAQASA